MNETCDRCGPAVRAEYRADRGQGFLLFCGHCATRHWSALSSKGWLLSPLSRIASVPQLNPPPSFEQTWPELAK